MASDALMQNGEAIARNGEALAAATTPAPCCCGGGTGCTFTHQPPPCTICAGTGANCSGFTGTAIRIALRWTPATGTVYSINESWPVAYCCADLAGMPYDARAFLQEEDIFCPNLHCRIDVTATGPADANGQVRIDRQGYSNNGQPTCALLPNAPSSEFAFVHCTTGLRTGLPLADPLNNYSNCGGGAGQYNYLSYSIYHHYVPGAFREYLFIGEVDSGPPPVYRPQFRVIKYTRESWGPVLNCSHVEPNCPPRGACCCGGQCYPELTAAECASGGGQWRGAGTTCSQECVGGCCTPHDGCVNMTFNACKAMGGAWLGGAPCTGLPTECDGFGACCDPVTGVCGMFVQSACVAPKVFLGVGTQCTPNNPCPQPPPPTGACCNSGSCTVQTEAACTLSGGSWLGANTNCNNPNTCSQPGACCTASGCQDVPGPEACASLGGAWQGPGTTCGGTTCPTGACCQEAGGGFCSVETPGNCAALGGIFMGVGTNCAGVSCTGACCNQTGHGLTCGQSTQAGCTGTFCGLGTVCPPPPITVCCPPPGPGGSGSFL